MKNSIVASPELALPWYAHTFHVSSFQPYIGIDKDLSHQQKTSLTTLWLFSRIESNCFLLPENKSYLFSGKSYGTGQRQDFEFESL